MLQQSCFSPQYQVGLIFLSSAQLDKWLATNISLDSTQYLSVGSILISNGFCTSITLAPFTCNGYKTYVNASGIMTGADVPWIWVSVPINGTTYQFDPASKIVPNNGGDGYLPYSRGLVSTLATKMGYDQTDFLTNARAGASGIGTPAINFSTSGRTNVRNKLTQYANNLASYLRDPTNPNPAAATADIIGGATIQLLPAYAPPASGTTLWGQTALPYPNQQGIAPTATASLSAFRTTLTLTLGWNDQSNNFTQLANPITFNSADLHGHRLTIQFDSSNIASLLLDGSVQAAASGAVPGTSRLTARAAINHPHVPCVSLPIPANCTNGPGPFVDTLRVTPLQGAVFNIGNGWGGVNRGSVERHRKLLRQALISGGSPAGEGVLGEGLAMMSSSWLAVNSREQFLIGQLSGTHLGFLHSVGIVGMTNVGSSSPPAKAPYVDLPINAVSEVQTVSRPAITGYTPVESSAFFNTLITGSMQEAAAIEQTQPKDVSGQDVVAASTIKLLDAWSTSGTIYDLNDPAVSGDDCSYYVSNVKSNLTNFTQQDKARVETLIGYSAASSTCSSPPSTTQVIVPSRGDIAIGLFNGTGYLGITPGVGISAIISG